MKLLIVGANGMLGNTLYRYFSNKYETIATSRSKSWSKDALEGYDISDLEKFDKLLNEFKPDIVLNCVGIIKQLKDSKDSIISIRANALWPHQLLEICKKHKAKMIHFSTDCVFTGKVGNYHETDTPDSVDLYGTTKRLGEVVNDLNALTLRTSIIGHEINTCVSLVDWFLSQKNECNGFSKAIYSGFPTISIAKIIDEYLIEKLMKNEIHGLYHLSSDPINKYDLLNIIAKEYNKNITIHKDEKFEIDRSLNSDKLRQLIHFKPRSWDEYVAEMHQDYQNLKDKRKEQCL